MQELLDDQSSAEQSRLSSHSIQTVRSISTWQRLMGVMLIILGLFIGIFSASALPSTSNGFWLYQEIYYVFLGVALVVSATYIYLGYLLIQQSRAFNEHLKVGNSADLDLAFKYNFQFWLIVGIAIILYFAFIIALLILGTTGANRLM